MRFTRRDLLTSGVVGGTLALAGCTNLAGGDGGNPGSGSRDGDENTRSPTPLPPATPNPPDGPVASVSLPSKPDSHRYAMMGDAAAPTITYFGNWKCPFCAMFATGSSEEMIPLPRIVTDYVQPGKVSLRYRALAYGPDGGTFLGPDAARAARAGLAVWNLDPDSYWPYHEYVMAHQPPETETWATTERLVRFAKIAAVSPIKELRQAIESGKYEQAVKQNTQAAVEAGIGGTPSLVIDGQVVSPVKGRKVRTLLDRVASRGGDDGKRGNAGTETGTTTDAA